MRHRVVVEKIQLAVNAYYAQFEGVGESGEQAGEAEAAPAETIVEEQPEEREAVEGAVDPAVAVAGESDTMDSPAQKLDESGEVHEG